METDYLQEEFAPCRGSSTSVVARADTEPVEVWMGCLRVCWQRVLDEDRPRIIHEYSNGWRDIRRRFVVSFVDGCRRCGRASAEALVRPDRFSQSLA